MKNTKLFQRTFIVLSVLLAQTGVAIAGTDVWTGGGGSANLFWLAGANWQSGSHPATGDELVFTNAVGLINSNNYPALQLFSGITFATPSGAFALNGNSVTLNNNITDEQPVTPETVNLPLILSGNVNVDVSANGTLNLATNISGTGGLTLIDSGTVNLTATNTFSGGLTVNAGTVAVNTDTNLGGGNIVLNGGTLQALATFNLITNRSLALGPTSGSGQGGISVNNLALVPNPLTTLSNGIAMANNGGGTGGLTKSGFGNLLLFGANTYTGATSNEVGTITLDFTQPTSPQNSIISSSSHLFFGGANAGAGETNFAQLTIVGSANNNNSQTFNNTHVTVGNAVIHMNSGAGHSANLALNALDHDAGGALTMVLPASGNITTTTANNNGILGGWANIASGAVSTGWNVATNWACNDGSGNIVNYSAYTIYSNAGTLMKTVAGAANNIEVSNTVVGFYTNDVDGAGSTNDYNSIVLDNSAVFSPTFFIGSNNVVRLGKFGGIFNRTTAAGFNNDFGGTNAVGPSVNGITNQLGIGTLTAGGPSGGAGEIVFVNTATGSGSGNNWIISAKIADNFAGPVSVILMGSGYNKFQNHNTYSGGTYLLGGRFQVAGTDIGTANYQDAMGTGPLYIFPGSYLYLGSSGATSVVGGITNQLAITNDLYMAGLGTVQEPDSGIRAGTANIIASKITLIGDSGIGGGATNGPAVLMGPISGPFNMYFGNQGNAGGGGTGLILSNLCNWTGNTYLMGRIGTAASATRLALDENNLLPSGFGYGNLYIGISGDNGNDIAFDLNGFNQTINGLFSASAGSQNHDIICNSSNATVSTLTIGNNDQSGLWGGLIINNSFFPTTASGPTTAIMAITKIGAGVETFTNVNTYSGNTTISNGVLQLTGVGSINTSSNVTINGGTFDVSALSYVIPAAQNINVSGGTFFINTASSGGGPANFTNGTLKVSSLSTVTANLTVPTLNIGGANNFIQPANIPPVPLYPIVYPIIKYTTLNGNASTFSAVLPSGGFPAFAGYVSNSAANSTIYLVLTNGPITPQLTWFGSVGGVLDSNWNTVDADWTNIPARSAASYSDGSLVIFNDIGNIGLINLATTFQPAGVTVANTNVNYTFAGTGSIGSGPSMILVTNGVTKLGPGKLTLDNTGGDSYNGGLAIGGGIVQLGVNDIGGSLGAPNNSVGNNGVLVFNRSNNNLVVTNPISGSGSLLVSNAGGTTLTLAGANSYSGGASVIFSNILQAGNASALGTGTNIVANGAALDVNGFSLSGAAVTTSGAGLVNSGVTNGAIYSSAASSAGPPSVTKVTMLGDTVFGCPPSVSNTSSNRWDIRGTGAALSTGGNSYNLIKVGDNQVSIVGAAVDPNLANIDVQGGVLGFQTSSTSLGNPSANLYIRNGAALEMYSATNQLNKQIQMGTVSSDNAGLLSDNGNNTVIGPMTFNGTVNVVVTNGTLTLSNTITGGGALNQNGPGGTLVLAGSDGHSGGTAVNSGTFLMNGINNSSGNANNQLTAYAGTVGGSGTYTVPVDIEGTLWPGVAGKPATLSVGNNVDYNDGLGDNFGALTFGGFGAVTTNIFSLNSTTNDLINVTGDLYANGAAIIINPLSALPAGTIYTLVNYSGSRSSAYNGTVQVVASAQPSRYQFTLDQGTGNNSKVKLTVSTGIGTMEWDNAAGNDQWDIDNSANWSNEVSHVSSDVFYQSDAVVLDNGIIASGATNVINITTNNPNGSGPSPVLPSSITVNSTTNYVINGPGSIGGTASLVKQGTSTLTINSANTFSGTISVYGGTLQLNAANTPASTLITNGTVLLNNTNGLGGVSAPVYITNSGTLDIGGSSLTANQIPLLGSEPIYISGWGVNSNGCLINSSTNNTQEDAFQNIIMTGDAAIGGVGIINGPGRFDIGRLTNNPTLSTGGHAYNLYKIGSNQVSFVAVTVDTNLGNIDIKGGELGFEQGTTSMGNPLSNATVEAGATLEFYNTTTNIVVYTKQFVVNGDGTTTNVFCNSGTVTINGNMTLNNVCGIGVAGTALTNNTVMSGSGGVIKTGGGLLILTNNETYTGNTTISGGTLQLLGIASINNSTNITLGGGTIDVSGRVNTTLTLGGQTLTGGGTINGSLSNLVGSTVSPSNGGGSSTNNLLTVTTNATLLGTTIMNLNGTTNDVIAVTNGNVAYGGTLTVTTNASGTTTLSAGENFQLFKAATYSGSFSTLNLPTLPAGLLWDTSQLTVSGTIKVVSSTPAVPRITGIVLNGTTLDITATNGTDNGTWTLLQSTNVALPLSQWQTNIQGSFDGSGDLSTNIANTVSNIQEFYILKQ